MESVLRGIGDAGEHVSHLVLWIDVFEFCRPDQPYHGRGAVGSVFGAPEQPGLAPQGESRAGHAPRRYWSK